MKIHIKQTSRANLYSGQGRRSQKSLHSTQRVIHKNKIKRKISGSVRSIIQKSQITRPQSQGIVNIKSARPTTSLTNTGTYINNFINPEMISK